MNDLELGWVAGLLEGEGCFSCRPRWKRKSLNVRVLLLMSDRDIVERFASLVGATASISERLPNKNRPNHKTCYAIAVCGQAAIELMKKVRPHMGARRGQKIDEAVALWAAVLHRRKMGLAPVCHPDRKHHSHGLCKFCANERMRRALGAKPMAEIRATQKPWLACGLTRWQWYDRGFHKINAEILKGGSQLSERQSA